MTVSAPTYPLDAAGAEDAELEEATKIAGAATAAAAVDTAAPLVLIFDSAVATGKESSSEKNKM